MGIQMKHAYLGREYPDAQIAELLAEFRQNRLVIRYLKDRLQLSEVRIIYSLDEWKTEPYAEKVMEYDEENWEYVARIDVADASSLCYRFMIRDTPDSEPRWEDKNKRNWYINLRNRIECRRCDNIAGKTAELIEKGNIVGWFQGGSEFGPRALGHRSILADPRKAEMKDILNEKVKHREPFRPFAPSVLLEYETEYFDLSIPSPFMLLVANVHEDKRGVIPAVTHVDGTARLQTVTKEDNGVYYDLIEEFRRLTGVPVILNTSFNVAGEPIVETPLDALTCFQDTMMDYLVLHDWLIWKV